MCIRDSNKISVFGQDSNPTTWKMAQMNLAIRGIEADQMCIRDRGISFSWMPLMKSRRLK